MEKRKEDHIELVYQSRIQKEEADKRFYYEPMLNSHPQKSGDTFSLAGKKQMAPIWVSSLTGGTRLAGRINRNLARVCKEFGLGMGLGSCRIILDDDTYFPDFDMRDEIGEDQPFFANLGIAQVEQLIESGKLFKIDELIKKLRVDGLIIHVNPLQEWFQPEGDRILYPPIHSIEKLITKVNFPVIVKEVGQGMGMESLRSLLKLPLEAVEFAAFGGANFTKIELLRSSELLKESFEPLSRVGHDAFEMTEMVNLLVKEEKILCKSLIISGGITSFLDGYYLISISKLPAIYGQASSFLQHAKGKYEELRQFVENQVQGLELAKAYLKVRQ